MFDSNPFCICFLPCFALTSNLWKPATSRYESLAGLDACKTFGFRGEALCSIADVSVVEIITKAQGMPHGYRKIMKVQKVEEFYCYCVFDMFFLLLLAQTV